jgi:hypothetical protein
MGSTAYCSLLVFKHRDRATCRSRERGGGTHYLSKSFRSQANLIASGGVERNRSEVKEDRSKGTPELLLHGARRGAHGRTACGVQDLAHRREVTMSDEYGSDRVSSPLERGAILQIVARMRKRPLRPCVPLENARTGLARAQV